MSILSYLILCTPSFHIPSLSGMLYLQGMICHSSNPKSSLLTCVMAVHSTNHALTAVIMILKDRNSLHIKIKIYKLFSKFENTFFQNQLEYFDVNYT